MLLDIIFEEINKIPFLPHHVFVFQLLVTNVLRNNLGKYSDVMLSIPTAIACWIHSFCESLLCSIFFTNNQEISVEGTLGCLSITIN